MRHVSILARLITFSVYSYRHLKHNKPESKTHSFITNKQACTSCKNKNPIHLPNVAAVNIWRRCV